MRITEKAKPYNVESFLRYFLDKNNFKKEPRFNIHLLNFKDDSHRSLDLLEKIVLVKPHTVTTKGCNLTNLCTHADLLAHAKFLYLNKSFLKMYVRTNPYEAEQIIIN